MNDIVKNEIMSYVSENEPETADVRQIDKLKPPALKKMQSRINNQREFNDAFTNWFEGLGVSTEEFKNRINITTSISHITDIMKEKGIKF